MDNPINIPRRAINKVGDILLHSFLKKVPGVIHIGANTGQERDRYASHGLNVLWVEPIPTVFEELHRNISGIANQRACRYLLAAEDGKEYTFHISNVGGVSSSIFDFARHREMCPHIDFTGDIRITATTLVRLIDIEQIDLRNYGALVLDTQGSELLVLKGAVPVLKHFRFIKTEAADFECYAGGCQFAELDDFMRQQGFTMHRKSQTFSRSGMGIIYDLLYHRL